MYKTYRIFLLIFLMSLFYGTAAEIVLSGTPFIKNYHREVYQAGSQTWDIEQGSNGMMYFANNNGLLEFDGNNWNVYHLPNNSNLRSIANGEKGILYAGGFNEIGYYSIESIGGAVYTSLNYLLPEEYLNFGDVWKIYNSPDGIIFQTYNQLMLYKDGKIDVITAPSLFHFSFMINNEYYVNDMEKGLLRYAMGELFPLVGIESLIGKEIWGIIPYQNSLIIATASEGIYLYNGNSLEKIENNVAAFLKKNQIYSTLMLNDNNIVFGTIQDGLLICDQELKPVDHLDMSDGLQNNTILCMEQDFLGNIWLGTDHGIDYVKINSPLRQITNNYGLSSGYTALINNDRIYLGTNQGLFTKKNKVATLSIETEKKLLSIESLKGQVWSLTEIDETIFCGHNNGAYIIKDTTAVKISDIPGAWVFIEVPNYPDKILCGTYTGLVVYEKKNNNWVFKKRLEGFSESTRKIKFDADGTLWMTHGYQGVYHLFFDNTYDSIIKVDLYNRANSNLPYQVTGLSSINNKILFLTTDGIFEFISENGDFFKNDQFAKVFQNRPVQEITTDSDNNLWYFAEGDMGVLRYGEDGNYIDVTLPFDELRGRFIHSFEIVYPYNENNVFIGTENGFVHYNPKFNKYYSYIFNTYLLSMNVNSLDTTIRCSIDTNNEIVLDFENNSVEFNFAANDFENPDKILYSTYLEGNDNSWSDWQNRTNRTYTNLYEGDYTFRVKAKNIYGSIVEGNYLKFKVDPPFERSVIAYVIYTILIIILIFLFSLLMKRRFNKAKLRDEKMQQEIFRKKEEKLRMEGLEAEKEIIRMRNEKLREGIKNKDKELANSTMQMLQKNEMLITLRDELKELANYIDSETHKHDIIRLVRGINKEIDNEKQWKVFETHFESVHEEFLKRIKLAFPKLTPRELKLCAYLRMNISSKEISVLMNISTRGVEISRYRLRKKLDINRDVNLTEFILSF